MNAVSRITEAPLHLNIYEVNDHGTLSAYGVEPPEFNRDIYPRLKLDESMPTDRLITVIEGITPLLWYAQELAEEALEEIRSALEDEALPVADRKALRAVVRELAKTADNQWKAWMQRLEGEPLQHLRQKILAWPDARINWHHVEAFPYDWGPQGQALNDIACLTEESQISLGLKIVYAEHPGSTYYAAELHADIESANAQAEHLGMSIRFIREGESADRFLAVPQQPPEDISKLDLAQELQQYFVPNFGVRPELRMGRDPEVEALRTVPPREQLCVHDASLFNSAWSRIVRAIREPVQVWVDDDDKIHVHVLGIGIYSFDESGQVRCHLWKINEIGQQKLTPANLESMSIDHLPWRFVWLGIWERAFALEVEASIHGGDVQIRQKLARQYAQWAFSVFKRHIRRSCDLRNMRQRIADAMPTDALVLDIAREANMVERRPVVMVSTYNRIAANLSLYRRLDRDAPRLALCFDMLSQCDVFPSVGEPLERLSKYLAKWRLSKRCWRMVAKSGPALWRPMVEFYDHPGRRAAIDYLKLLDKLGWHEPADPAFMRIVLSLRGGPGGFRNNYSVAFKQTLTTLKRIVNWFELADAPQRAAMLAHLHLVLGWLDDEGATIVASAPRQPTWVRLVRLAKLGWEQRLKEQRVQNPAWEVPADRVAVQGFEIRFISTARSLIEEALTMRHCIFDFAEECGEAACLVGSVRHLATGRRVATALYRPNGRHWELDQIAGFANAAVSEEIRSVATTAAYQLTKPEPDPSKPPSMISLSGTRGLKS